MAYSVSSKEASAALVDPFNEPQPSDETGPGASLGQSTFAGMPSSQAGSSAAQTHARSSSNPFRNPPQDKSGVSSSARPVGRTSPSSHGSPRARQSPGGRTSPPTKFPEYRDAAFGGQTHRPRGSSENPPPSYDAAIGSSSGGQRRRTSSLAQRYPGDTSHQPLDMIRKNSRKADKPHHLKKRSMQGPDTIDRLDPALGGRAYHHEGPYDAASLARNRDPKHAPVAALESTNREAIRATPQENVKDAVERHMPLDGTAVVPPGESDRLGRTYDYEEGTDMMREGFNGEPGYKRWGGKDYDPDDLKGQGDTFGLDRALRAHKIDDTTGEIELQDSSALRKEYKKKERQGLLDTRDPTDIAGDDGRYTDVQAANDTDLHTGRERSGSLRAAGDSIKRRIGSLKHKHRDD